MGGRVMDEYIERGTLMRRIKEIHCAECDSYHFSYINSDGDMRYCSYGERKDGTDAEG